METLQGGMRKSTKTVNNVLITGAAGFIGFHTAFYLLNRHINIIGVDNINDYYDPKLKTTRLGLLGEFYNFEFIKSDINNPKLYDMLNGKPIDVVIHLAAQAGVRHCITKPGSYIESNLDGFFRMLDYSNFRKLKFIYASSSSVYGNNTLPWVETMKVDQPMSLYGATKIANEVMAESYTKMYGTNCIGLRFFTVYGAFGRPDMAVWKWTKGIDEGTSIDIYNHGDMKRNFTYVSDIVAAIESCVRWDLPGHKIYNLGNDISYNIGGVVDIIGNILGKTPVKNYLPMQACDIKSSAVNIDRAMTELDFIVTVPIIKGLNNFVKWYLKFKE